MTPDERAAHIETLLGELAVVPVHPDGNPYAPDDVRNSGRRKELEQQLRVEFDRLSLARSAAQERANESQLELNRQMHVETKRLTTATVVLAIATVVMAIATFVVAIKTK